MGITVTLRDTDEISYFKELSLELIRACEPDEIMICSGYFSEASKYSPSMKPIKDKFYFSLDKDSHSKNIIELLKDYQTNVILVGHMPTKSGVCERSYKNLFANCKSHLGLGKVKAYKCVAGNWHAKEMFIRKNIDGVMTTVAGVVGSSNCTRPAYGDINSSGSSGKGFNVEADTFIYDDKYDSVIQPIVFTFQQEDGDEVRVIQTQYQPSLNGNKSIIQLLNQMHKRVEDRLSSQLGEFEELH